MDYDKIVKLLSDPDHVAEGLTELNDYHKTVTTQLETLTKQNTDNEAKIKDLRDSNMKLYLRITGQADVEEEEEKDAYETLIDKLKGDNN